jgi:hypothetical protein
MGSRYRKQEEMRLTLDGGDWLLVRKHLTAGEQREGFSRILTYRLGERLPEVHSKHLGLAMVVAYLIDWSITDADDKPIAIRDQPYEFVAAALEAQLPESFNEILAAVQAHDAAMVAAREQEKKVQAGASAPDPTSTSVA